MPAALRTPNERDQLVEGPLLDEVVPTHHTQCCEHGAFGPVDRTHHLRLDLRVMVGELNQDNVAYLKPLNLDIERHGLSVCRRLTRSACRPDTSAGAKETSLGSRIGFR